MSEYRMRLAKEIEVHPAYVKGQEEHGLCYFTWHDSNAVGAQCSCCNSVVWVNARLHPILNEKKPYHIPDSGPEYRCYYQDNLQRFLKSLPKCPSCGKNSFDRFINNVLFPRYADGSEVDDQEGNIELIYENPDVAKVWWLDF